jgi:hypothetical protein
MDSIQVFSNGSANKKVPAGTNWRVAFALLLLQGRESESAIARSRPPDCERRKSHRGRIRLWWPACDATHIAGGAD